MPEDAVIAWSGDVGMPVVERVQADIDHVLTGIGGGRLIVDFADVGFVEPVAVGVLVHARNRAVERGVELVLRAMPPRAKRLLAMTGLTDMFVFDDPPPRPVTGENLPARASLPAVPDAEFDEIAELARQLLGVPTAVVTLVGRHEQVYPGAAGLGEPWQEQRRAPLSHSVCKYVVDRAAPLVVDDARREPLLAETPAVREVGVVAYAGMPLTDVDGRVVGALCAVDPEPHAWTADELDALRGLAAACSAALRLRTLARRAAR